MTSPSSVSVPNNKLNGILLINKESGVTSHDVVFSLRKIVKDKQVGHIGTLDPLADGLLVCLVGESVKLSDYLMGSDKKYRLTLKLGVETDSWDSTGNILKTFDAAVDKETLESSIHALSGDQNLPIPMYSAKKVNGQKLYEIARNDKTIENFEGPLKEMKFWAVEILNIQMPFVTVEFRCSKGSFVRSWIHILGKQLGTGAIMTALKRLAIGEYTLENSATLGQLREKNLESIRESSSYLTQWNGLQGRTLIELTSMQMEKLKNGLVSYDLSDRIAVLGATGNIFCFFQTQLIGILHVSDVIEVKRIFVNSSH